MGRIMAFLGRALMTLKSTMPRPQPYGWFHISTTLASVLLGLLLSRLAGGKSQARVRTVFGVTAATVIVAEVLKQVLMSLEYDGTSFSWEYPWEIFPFQFCSTPMYIGLIAALTKGRAHRACSDYLGSFALFAGMAVLAYPAQIYHEFVVINIQTTLCHGSMIALGVYLLKTGYVQPSRRTWYRATVVFFVNVGIAVLMNEIAFRVGLLETDMFNMFFFSPYCEPTMVVYSWVQATVPYPWCLLIYVLGFSSLAGGVLLGAKLLHRSGKSVDRR